MRGIARLVAEFLDRLDRVTLVGNDTGGALVRLHAPDGAARLGRIALVSCEAFDNFPPGLTGKTLMLIGRLPPSLFSLLVWQMRLRPLKRTPGGFRLAARGRRRHPLDQPRLEATGHSSFVGAPPPRARDARAAGPAV